MTLTPGDLALHAALGIPAELLAAAGVRRVDDIEGRELLMTTRPGSMAGILYPHLDPVSGQMRGFRIRRDHPELDPTGKPEHKYLAPPGRHHLAFAPNVADMLRDASVTAVIVESEKAVLALHALAARAARRLLVVGTGGCWSWKGRVGRTTDATGARVDEKGPLPDFDRIAWTGRDTVIAFDANAASNPSVQAARRALAAELV